MTCAPAVAGFRVHASQLEIQKNQLRAPGERKLPAKFPAVVVLNHHRLLVFLLLSTLEYLRKLQYNGQISTRKSASHTFAFSPNPTSSAKGPTNHPPSPGRIKRNNAALRDTVHKPVEEARLARLSEKLLEVAKSDEKAPIVVRKTEKEAEDGGESPIFPKHQSSRRRKEEEGTLHEKRIG